MTSKGAEKMQKDTIGVDVSKDHLDAHRLADGASRRFANHRSGHRAFVKWLAQRSAGASSELRFESPQLHQEVRANRRDFLRHRIARHFSSLPRQGPVSAGVRRFSGAIPGASCRKSLAAKFRFQGCCLPHVHRARSRMWGVEPRHLIRFEWMDHPSREDKRAATDRSLRLRRRLESERAPLIRPRHRQVDETLETKPAWQASFDCRFDDLRREESER
jgi:hypothetical protein